MWDFIDVLLVGVLRVGIFSPASRGCFSEVQGWGWWAFAALNPRAWIRSLDASYTGLGSLWHGSACHVEVGTQAFRLTAGKWKWCKVSVVACTIEDRQCRRVLPWTELFWKGKLQPGWWLLCSRMNHCVLCCLTLLEASFPFAGNCTVLPPSTKTCHTWHLFEFNFVWFLSHLYLWSFSPQGRTNLVTSLFQSPVPMKRDHPAALCWGQRIDWSQCAFCHLHNVFF